VPHRSKGRVCDRSLDRIPGSNPAGRECLLPSSEQNSYPTALKMKAAVFLETLVFIQTKLLHIRPWHSQPNRSKILLLTCKDGIALIEPQRYETCTWGSSRWIRKHGKLVPLAKVEIIVCNLRGYWRHEFKIGPTTQSRINLHVTWHDYAWHCYYQCVCTYKWRRLMWTEMKNSSRKPYVITETQFV
jgi:hypothetical protein